MDVIIRNKWVSLGGSSVVKDINENDILKVKGKIATITSKKYLCDMNDDVKFIIKRKVFSLFNRTCFVLDKDEKMVAKVRRKVVSLGDRYFIDSPIGNIEISGNILEFDYNILLNGTKVGHISRKISVRDSFVLSIDDSCDYVFFTALVIAIDNITDVKDGQ